MSTLPPRRLCAQVEDMRSRDLFTYRALPQNITDNGADVQNKDSHAEANRQNNYTHESLLRSLLSLLLFSIAFGSALQALPDATRFKIFTMRAPPAEKTT